MFFHLLLSAAAFETAVDGVRLKPGQILTTMDEISEECGITKQQTRRVFKTRQKTHEITHERTHNKSLVTLVRWAFYQLDDSKRTRERTHERTHQKTHDSAKKNIPSYYIKNNKEKGDEKEGENSSFSSEENASLDGFSEDDLELFKELGKV